MPARSRLNRLNYPAMAEHSMPFVTMAARSASSSDVGLNTKYKAIMAPTTAAANNTATTCFCLIANLVEEKSSKRIRLMNDGNSDVNYGTRATTHFHTNGFTCWKSALDDWPSHLGISNIFHTKYGFLNDGRLCSDSWMMWLRNLKK